MMYGRDELEWDELVDEGHEFLIERARLGRTTTYTELNTVVRERTRLKGFDFSRDADRAAMGYLLGRIVDKDRETNPELMISALVIYLNATDAGSGFYAKAKEVGLLKDGMDRLEFWVRQLQQIQDRYRRRQRTAAGTTPMNP
ncbi:hypothetical protein [Sinomonas sp. P47F7]|uniref:hypothetical protein n=1 Tax=Sinomonas sp. P47F7 TaxID=3410987 RepID=UPI003BF50836